MCYGCKEIRWPARSLRFDGVGLPMPEKLTFHFEGSLADEHRMNFYEAARFQYAAARLLVKLAQFRATGRFSQKITDKSNYSVQLSSQADGSFNINVEVPKQGEVDDDFLAVPLSDLLAFVCERIIDKVDREHIDDVVGAYSTPIDDDSLDEDADSAYFEALVDESMADDAFTSKLPAAVKDLVRRRAAELYRERRLIHSEDAIKRIDFARSQKLIAMSAPLVSEMATALRRSADTLQVRSGVSSESQTVLFLDQQMAREIETAIVDKDITPILGDITQFNKDNGWGKVKIRNHNGPELVSFSIPYDILPKMRQQLIDGMKIDMVYLQTYFVRDRSGKLTRLIAVGILPTPTL